MKLVKNSNVSFQWGVTNSKRKQKLKKSKAVKMNKKQMHHSTLGSKVQNYNKKLTAMEKKNHWQIGQNQKITDVKNHCSCKGGNRLSGKNRVTSDAIAERAGQISDW